MRTQYLLLSVLTAALARSDDQARRHSGPARHYPGRLPGADLGVPGSGLRGAAGRQGATSASTTAGVYRIEIPEKWNGELMLSSHGFVSNAGPEGSRLRVGNPAIREHLIQNGFAWGASSYRCNGYVPGNGAAGHDGPDRHVHDVQRRTRARARRTSPAPRWEDTSRCSACTSSRRRSPAAWRCARRDRSSSTSSPPSARRPRSSPACSSAQPSTVSAGSREDVGAARESRRTTPTRDGSWRACRSRSAADHGRSPSKGWRRGSWRTSAAARSPAAPRRRASRSRTPTSATRWTKPWASRAIG